MILALSFVAGLLTILNPCVLPLLPVVLAGAATSSRFGPLALALGLAASFAVSGVLLASAGIEFGESRALRFGAAGLLLVAGLALALPAVGEKLGALLAPLAGGAARLAGGLSPGLAGQFGAGALLGLAWAPCVGPTLGAAFALAASGGSKVQAAAAMGVFALGAATSLLLAGSGARLLAARGRGRLARAAHLSRRLFGVALVLVAVLILTGLDKTLEGIVVAALPDWFVSLATRF
ncbi:thiol:disulfide interchange protein precursor [Azorhizobium caulinodans ORS 571]|uniref:Thiol:disulfide interchange protein n=1 Tax=Azorhizobium caulinodans (strain ATCC 43989 / DSM 5975 / JCM 20966 / LMG 6465 / NBRC 14845 / NCIMB 13405 / ORS 571) TaxID=438753 RepID=A8IEJ1_AZOC5|nr:cytochrome c biogenesis protein CcdA [Azorhizobium caulinodans]BAF89496.1 thiol:disulfide interchange protein precursor [Azorhizobium caulinodans ORS 571]